MGLAGSHHSWPDRVAFIAGAVSQVSAATLLGVSINGVLLFARTLFLMFEEFPLTLGACPERILGGNVELFVGALAFVMYSSYRVVKTLVAVFALSASF